MTTRGDVAAPGWSEDTHNADGRGLAVRESLLPGAGSGLFATGAWAGGAIICEYRGKMHTLREMLHLKDRTYLMALSLNLYIDSGPADGVAGPLSLGRFLNDHPDPSRINVRFEKMPSRSKALCVATRDVVAGEELYVSYGEKYWARLGGIPGGGGGEEEYRQMAARMQRQDAAE